MFQIVCLKNRLLFISFCIILFSCKNRSIKLPYYNAPDFTPLFIQSENDVDRKITHTISNFSFVDQDSNEVSQKNVEGKIHLANFFFTSCGSICPVLMKNMHTISMAFTGDTNVVLLSYSVAPWIDSVGKLRNYVITNNYEAANWHLLTGNKTTIYRLARQSYFAEEETGFNSDSSNFLHTEHFILVDKNRRIRGIYNGTLELETNQIIDDIKELEKE